MSYYLKNPDLFDEYKPIITEIKKIMGLQIDCYFNQERDTEPMLCFENVYQDEQKKLDILSRWVQFCLRESYPLSCEAKEGKAFFPLEVIRWAGQGHSLGINKYQQKMLDTLFKWGVFLNELDCLSCEAHGGKEIIILLFSLGLCKKSYTGLNGAYRLLREMLLGEEPSQAYWYLISFD